MFAYPCPSCRQRLLAPVGRIGQRSICPKCLHPFTVPHPEQVVTGGPFAPAGAAPEPRVDGSCCPAGARVDPIEGEYTTPAPMNTVPARTGEFFELERSETVTEHFLELPPVVFTPPPPTGVPLTRLSHKEPDGRVTFDPPAPPADAPATRLRPNPLPVETSPPVSGGGAASGGWVVGTLAGVAAWLLGVWPAPPLPSFVAVVGGAMAGFGLLWRAYLCGRGGAWAKGLLALLPPVCLIQLVRPVAGIGLRPLWFVLSGVGLLGLFVVGNPVKRWVDDTFEAKRAAPPVDSTPLDLDAVARRLENRADREGAKKTLLEAGAAAEPAARKLLANKADGTVLVACDVLAEIGTADTVPALRKLADDTSSKAVRIEAATAADEIEKRLQK